eukprot:2248001-Pleurochrysis_carterae.AAC.1
MSSPNSTHASTAREPRPNRDAPSSRNRPPATTRKTSKVTASEAIQSDMPSPIRSAKNGRRNTQSAATVAGSTSTATAPANQRRQSTKGQTGALSLRRTLSRTIAPALHSLLLTGAPTSHSLCRPKGARFARASTIHRTVLFRFSNVLNPRFAPRVAARSR